MKLAQVLELAPPTPPCFPDRLQWAEYLHQAQGYGKKQTARPFENGVFRPSFNFCTDCSATHAAQMRMVHRCRPLVLRTITLDRKVVPIHVAP